MQGMLLFVALTFGADYKPFPAADVAWTPFRLTAEAVPAVPPAPPASAVFADVRAKVVGSGVTLLVAVGVPAPSGYTTLTDVPAGVPAGLYRTRLSSAGPVMDVITPAQSVAVAPPTVPPAYQFSYTPFTTAPVCQNGTCGQPVRFR